jgi:hypothetical protein
MLSLFTQKGREAGEQIVNVYFILHSSEARNKNRLTGLVVISAPRRCASFQRIVSCHKPQRQEERSYCQ